MRLFYLLISLNKCHCSATFDFLDGYSLPGVSKYVRACGLQLRCGRPQYYSPDPAYRQKEAYLLQVLGQVGLSP